MIGVTLQPSKADRLLCQRESEETRQAVSRFSALRSCHSAVGKKIRGKHHYFGPWADPDAALRKYLDEKDALHAGRTPSVQRDGLTIADLCNDFLTHKRMLVDSGELAQRTFDRYHATCGFVVSMLGQTRPVDDLRPDDFQSLRGRMAKRWGVVALSNEIQIVRSIFRYGFDAGILEKSLRFGPGFKKPSAKSIRQNRAARGPQMFESSQVHSVLEVATTNLRAMVLLAVNGALGNTDIAELPIRVFDLESGWLGYARQKTGIPRRIPLWDETTAAIADVLKQRPTLQNPEDASLLFIGRRGKSYAGNHKGYRVTAEMNRGMKRAGVTGRTFYDLRRTFQTIGEEARDLVAVQAIMGHAPASGDMSAIYRQKVSDERLLAVTNVVHDWLFGSGVSE